MEVFSRDIRKTFSENNDVFTDFEKNESGI
jgi:hypothetical protein